MPGVRGVEGEGKEFRLGEGPDAEVKVIEKDAAPFLKQNLPTEGGVPTSYEAAKSGGLKDFMAIGERGSLPEERVADQIRRYDFPNVRSLPREGTSSGPVEMPVAEPSGLRAVWDSVTYYFKKTLDIYLGGMG